MLTLKQLEYVCLYSSGSEQCRYLDQDIGTGNYVCKKKSADKTVIDKNVSSILDKCKKSNIDPDTLGYALGDNCSGYHLLVTIPQGFDV